MMLKWMESFMRELKIMEPYIFSAATYRRKSFLEMLVFHPSLLFKLYLKHAKERCSRSFGLTRLPRFTNQPIDSSQLSREVELAVDNIRVFLIFNGKVKILSAANEDIILRSFGLLTPPQSPTQPSTSSHGLGATMHVEKKSPLFILCYVAHNDKDMLIAIQQREESGKFVMTGGPNDQHLMLIWSLMTTTRRLKDEPISFYAACFGIQRNILSIPFPDHGAE